jgi:hypothetical protein
MTDTFGQPEDHDFEVGDCVEHATYKRGLVEAVIDDVITVQFDQGGQKRIKAKWLAPAKADILTPANDNKPIIDINPAMWDGVPIPTREWYVPDLIPMRQVTILAGDGGVGKSLLALQVAAAGAMSVDTLADDTGEGFLPLAGQTLYIGAEDEAEEFHRRLADICRAHGRTMADLWMMRLVPLADRDAYSATIWERRRRQSG